MYEPNEYDVWVVVKDPGGIKAVVPILNKLRNNRDGSRALRCLLILNGKAVTFFPAATPDTVTTFSANAHVQIYPLPKLLITSMCSGGGVGRDLVPLLREQGVMTVAIQDYWGGGLYDDWKDEKYRPNYIVVNDEVASQIVLDAWPEFDPSHIFATGSPAFDAYASIDIDATEQKVRRLLGMHDHRLPIVLFAGQGEGTGASLLSLVHVLNKGRFACYFVPRPHPRMTADFLSEMPLWQSGLAQFGHPTAHLVVDWFNQCTTSELVAACAGRGVVVSMFSTVLAEAACLKAPTISILYPNDGMRVFTEAVPWAKPELLTAPLGCARVVQSEGELEQAVWSVLRPGGIDWKQRSVQSRYFPNAGTSTDRAAFLIRDAANLP